ncbi:DUF4270 domain-containing protein [Fulvivirga maritima]|uniref:DUF4270 family protein n=1 Tax=Fulvivirga maritima TaxID=2904247 RepID=UPI001F245FAC|nr:DUF4270 family protein [Fulvivirga maritima]UII27844.1 DUF4270 domain-containing protein [Fulvivirga maritima]
MNLWARTKGLILLSALTFFSCEEDFSTVGLQPIDSLGVFFAEIPLKDHISQIWLDSIATGSINTGAQTALLAGQYQDPELGHIEAKAFAEILPSRINPGSTFDESATYDSLVMELRVTSAYGLHDIPLEVTIHRITESIEIDSSTFYSTASEQATGEILGQRSFTVYADSASMTVEDTKLDALDPADSTIIANFYDSNGRYRYHHNVRLDDSFGEDFFNRLKSEDAIFQDSSLTSFIDYFAGLSIQSNSGNSIITYSVSGGSALRFYYHETNDEGNVEANSLAFNISNRYYNNISPNRNIPWSGPGVSSINSFYTPYELGEKVYVQSGTGLVANIDLSFLRDFGQSDSTRNAVIQRAQIFFKNPELEGTFAPPASIAYYSTNTENLLDGRVALLAVPSAASNSQLSSTYDSTRTEYKADIPHYLRTIDRNLTDYDRLTIYPAGMSQSVNRFAVNKDDVYIHLYYTVPEPSEN